MRLDIVNEFQLENLFSAYDIAEIAIQLVPSAPVPLKRAMFYVRLAGTHIKDFAINTPEIIANDDLLKYGKSSVPITKTTQLKDCLAKGQLVAFYLDLATNFLDCMKDLPVSIRDHQPTYELEITGTLILENGEKIRLVATEELPNPWLN